MPTQTDGLFCPDISSTPHKMAWNRLWACTLEYTFCIIYLAPKSRVLAVGFRNPTGVAILVLKNAPRAPVELGYKIT